MGAYSGMARGDLRWNGPGKMAFTLQGQESLAKLVEAGAPFDEIADYFCVEVSFIIEQTNPGGPMNELYRHHSAKFKRIVRENQVALSKENAAMAKHLGHHALKQAVNPIAEEPGLENRVSGMPDWEQNPDDWVSRHKPAQTKGSTIETLQGMRAARKSQEAEEKAAEGENPTSPAADATETPQEAGEQASE